MNNKREIIDIHHHIIPKIYKDALKENWRDHCGWLPYQRLGTSR